MPGTHEQVGTSATLGTNSMVIGTIMASASITSSAGVVVNGQLLALNGAVTLISDVVTLPALCTVSSAAAAVNPLPISLGAAASFAILAGSAITSTGSSTVKGNVGLSPGSAITGFPPAAITGGAQHINDVTAAAAIAALTTAYIVAAGLPSAVTVASDLGGLTLSQGVYSSATSLALTGTLTLSGNFASVFVFQIRTTLVLSGGAAVVLVGGVQPCNVFFQVGCLVSCNLRSGPYWPHQSVSLSAVYTYLQVGSSATLGASSTLVGTVMAYTSITVNAGAVVSGALLAVHGTVTLIDDMVMAPLICVTSSSSAATNPLPISLGAAAAYAILASSAISSTGSSTVKGDMGLSPGTAVSGFPPATLAHDSVPHIADVAAAHARAALGMARSIALSMLSSATISGDVGGLTLTSGVYSSTSSLAITGTLTLTGTASSVFIFIIGSTLTTAANSSVFITSPVQPCNVFFVVGSSATIGADSFFVGAIMAYASISVGAGAHVNGQLLAANGAVTLINDAIQLPMSCVSANAAPSPLPVVLDAMVNVSGTLETN